MARDFAKEYREYHSKPKQIKNRASRNAARKKVVEKLGADAVKGQDVSHQNNVPTDNAAKNLKLESPHVNRGRKTKKGRR